MPPSTLKYPLIETLSPSIQEEGKRCPLCAFAGISSFLHRQRVPTLTNLILRTPEAATQVAQGEMDLCFCEHCSFVFNRSFDATRLRYDSHYDNSQASAGTFADYLTALVRYLVKERNVHGQILEVGCGDGRFLQKLIEASPGSQGYGVDPSYHGPTHTLDGRVQFAAQYYDEQCAALPVDALLCRHVIEHVPFPLRFLQMLRRTLAPGTRIFLETPCIEWILRNRVIWDIYYEHVNYFSASTLLRALALAGFQPERVTRLFGGQYLFMEACVEQIGGSEATPLATTEDIPTLASLFQLHERHWHQQWTEQLRTLNQDGPVALLGAAGKGVTFANQLDQERQWLCCVADLNPRKHQHFLPGTGHPIVSYDQLRHFGVTSAILLNPNYVQETLALLKQHHLPIRLVTSDGSSLPLEAGLGNKEHPA